MHDPVIAIIGAGNMGGSLLAGLIEHGHPRDKLWATDPNEEKLLSIKNTFHVNTTQDNEEAIRTADVVILAVKPQTFSSLLETVKPVIQATQPLIISIAAGVREESIQKCLGGEIAIIRAMPNTPALIGCGATALYANQYVSTPKRQLAESLLQAVGVVVWVDKEHLMDTVTALSGSGPAYFFLVMEALQGAAQQLGLSPEVARLLTLQTAFGASKMAMESRKPLDKLRQEVTSPGGTTEKAISILEENHLREIFKKALDGAKVRSEELAKLLGDNING